MTYQEVLDALSDPTRRRIFERLQRGPRSVGELAEGLPVSRPAVSQHLRVLRRAGLVVERRQGTRRIYRMNPAGLAPLRRYLERFWEESLEAFKKEAESGRRREERAMSGDTIEPVRKSIEVKLPVEEAFDLFTRGLSRWWPLATHSVSGERAVGCRMEPRTGGRIYETRDDGEEHEWGRVIACEAPRRVVLGWHPGREASTEQEVEVTFSAVGADRTRVDLEHRDWHKLGDRAAETRQGYESGWDLVLGSYVLACETAVAG